MKRLCKMCLILCLLAGCVSGGFDSVKKTTQLRQGMTYQEVVQFLGEPESSEIKGNSLIATFSLHQSWKGNVPYDLVFDSKKRTLQSRGENKAKYEASQKTLSQIAESLSQMGGGSAAGSKSGLAGGAPSGPNDPNLQREIAGIWWGYSGSTERKIGLCPDGSYMDYTESGYSGRSHDQYGGQTMAWGSGGQSGGSGRWTISGNDDSGTIHVVYSNGRSANIKYRQINNPGCLSFDGNTLCRKQATCQ